MNSKKGLNLSEIKSTSESNNWTIYEHISPSGNIYIGITSTKVDKRWKYGSGYYNCTIFYKAIKKYGWNNFQHNIIASNLGEMTAKNMEKDLIKYYKSKNISYNITNGGDGHLGCSWNPSDATRKLWSKQRKNRTLSEGWKLKISESMKNQSYRISSESHLKSAKTIKEKYSKAVIQLSMNNEEIREFYSLRDAARSLGSEKKVSDIIKCCKGKSLSCMGYKWRYK